MLVEMYRKVFIEKEMTDKALTDAIKVGWQIVSVDDKLAIGLCESCNSLILTGDKYVMHIDNGYVCGECALKEIMEIADEIAEEED